VHGCAPAALVGFHVTRELRAHSRAPLQFHPCVTQGNFRVAISHSPLSAGGGWVGAKGQNAASAVVARSTFARFRRPSITRSREEREEKKQDNTCPLMSFVFRSVVASSHPRVGRGLPTSMHDQGRKSPRSGAIYVAQCVSVGNRIVRMTSRGAPTPANTRGSFAQRRYLTLTCLARCTPVQALSGIAEPRPGTAAAADQGRAQSLTLDVTS